MLTSSEFVRKSLETHLFFARIMKEHALFLETSFTIRDENFRRRANEFRIEFDKLLVEVLSLSNGVISQEAVRSGEIVTKYTLNAELVTAALTGLQIQTQLTQAEAGLHGGVTADVSPLIEQKVYMLNQKAIELINAIIQFKSSILTNVLSCQMFTTNYPLLINHIIDEAKSYLTHIQRLQSNEQISVSKEAYEAEVFWNKIMAEHAKFIRGLLDPSEEQLFNIANKFGNEFDKLTRDAKKAMDRMLLLYRVTNSSISETRKLRDFKSKGTQGLLDCKIKSIIIPLLSDHVLREANHYLRELESFSK